MAEDRYLKDGWSSEATRRLALWLLNDEELYHHARRWDNGDDFEFDYGRNAPAFLPSHVVEEVERAGGFSQVNWTELFAALHNIPYYHSNGET